MGRYTDNAITRVQGGMSNLSELPNYNNDMPMPAINTKVKQLMSNYGHQNNNTSSQACAEDMCPQPQKKSKQNPRMKAVRVHKTGRGYNNKHDQS